MNAPWARGPEPVYADEYEPYPVEPAASVGAVKRDKRRKDMGERVERLKNDNHERRDKVFSELTTRHSRHVAELFPRPIYKTDDPAQAFDPTAPGASASALALADPNVPDLPDTFNMPYLIGLHRISMLRANQLLAIRLFHEHQVETARKLYEGEVERIEDEYEGATKGVVERLLEGIEERRKRLNEEKEGEGTNLEALLDPQSRAHGTRRMRGGLSRGHGPARNGKGSGTDDRQSTPDPAGNFGFFGVADPLNLGASLFPNNPGVLHSLAGAGPTASILSGSLGARRKPGVRAQPGLPPTHYIVQSGQYHQLKSLAGLSSLRGDEVEGDLGEVRRKRARTAGGGVSRRRAGNGD